MKAQNSLFLCDHLRTNLSVKSSHSGANGNGKTCQTVRKSEVETKSDVGAMRWMREELCSTKEVHLERRKRMCPRRVEASPTGHRSKLSFVNYSKS